MEKVNINDFDKEKLEKLGLIENDILNDKFYNVYQIYGAFLFKYLDRILFLKKYDLEIRCSGLNIKSVEDMDSLQKISYLKYIYLGNILHIENLTKEDIELLNQKFLDNNYKYDLSIINLIENTYIQVIKSNNPYISLILVFEYNSIFDMYEKNSLEEQFNKNAHFVNEVIDKFKTDAVGKLNIPISIRKIEYRRMQEYNKGYTPKM